jgi:heme exporter protein B
MVAPSARPQALTSLEQFVERLVVKARTETAPRATPATTPLGDAAAVWAVARKDLLLEVRSKEVTVATLFFSGLVLGILALALGPDDQTLREAAAGVFWVALAFAGVISAAQSYASELEEGAFEHLLLYPVPRATLFLGKLLANWIFLTLLGALLLPISAAVFGASLTRHLPWLLLTVTLGTFGFALIATFYAALTANLRARESLLPVLIFPVIAPVIVAAVRSSAPVMLAGDPGQSLSWIQLLVGFNLAYLVVCSAIFPFVVEE